MIPVYFITHFEFITGQDKKVLSRVNKNEIKCFDFSSMKRALRLEKNYSWINFNISICFPLREKWRFYHNKLLYLQTTQSVNNFLGVMQRSYAKDLNSVNTKSNLCTYIFIFNEPAQAHKRFQMLHGNWSVIKLLSYFFSNNAIL